MRLSIPYFREFSKTLFNRTKAVHFSSFKPSISNDSGDQCFARLSRSKNMLLHSQKYNWKPQPHRTLSTTSILQADAEMVDVTFITSDGTKLKTKGKVGDNLLDVVVNNNVDLDGFGACEGTLACSTCHLVFKQADFDKIKDKVTDEELDMLDLAYGLKDTSRLGCQVTLTKELAGVEVEVPAGVNDARS